MAEKKLPEWVVFVRVRAVPTQGKGEGRYTGHVSAASAEDALNAVRETLQINEVRRIAEARAILLKDMPEGAVAPLNE